MDSLTVQLSNPWPTAALPAHGGPCRDVPGAASALVGWLLQTPCVLVPSLPPCSVCWRVSLEVHLPHDKVSVEHSCGSPSLEPKVV